MSTVTAQSNYIRSTPKKLRETAKSVKGLPAHVAIERLTLMGTKAAKLIAKTVMSARANATQTGKIDPVRACIQTIIIGKGPMFKRYQAVSRGMAHEIRKRTAHIRVVLESK